MATVKPTVDPKWSTNNVVTDNIEPLASIKDGGIVDGGVLGREHLNWQLNAISQWVDWIRAAALDKDSNLAELTDKNTARTNLELNTNATTLACNTSGNAGTATKLQNPRTFSLSGDASGSVNFDGSGNVNISVTVADDSHTHGTATITSILTSVLGASTAGLELGAVGSYAFLSINTETTTINENSFYSGSSLQYFGAQNVQPASSATGNIVSSNWGTSPSGTWRAMGHYGSVSNRYSATLFLRVA